MTPDRTESVNNVNGSPEGEAPIEVASPPPTGENIDDHTAQELDSADLNAISWQINAAVDLGGTFGVADSASTILASIAPES